MKVDLILRIQDYYVTLSPCKLRDSLLNKFRLAPSGERARLCAFLQHMVQQTQAPKLKPFIGGFILSFFPSVKAEAEEVSSQDY